MDENIFETQAHLEKRSKVREFYNNNKKIIFSILSILIAFLIYLNFYIESKKNKHITLSDSYIDAKIYIEYGEDEKAIKVLKDIIKSKNDTYAALSLFLLIDKTINIYRHDQKWCFLILSTIFMALLAVFVINLIPL